MTKTVGFAEGQPPKLAKPGVKDRLLQALSRGASYTLASGYAGITYKTFRFWMIRAEDYIKQCGDKEPNYEDGDIYYQLYCDVKRVEAAAAINWLVKIDEAASKGHWQAAAWKLERRYPKQYGRTDKNNNTSDDYKDKSLNQAKDEVMRLKSDEHGRLTTTKD